MKHILIAATILSLFSCKKDDPRDCYRCTQKYTVYSSHGNYQMADYTTYCDKTEAEIRQIEDLAPKGTVGSRFYLQKTCVKQ